MARSDPIADASLPDMRARSRPGTAIAAMMPMIATTISSSIKVKPFDSRIFIVHSLGNVGAGGFIVEQPKCQSAEVATRRLEVVGSPAVPGRPLRVGHPRRREYAHSSCFACAESERNAHRCTRRVAELNTVERKEGERAARGHATAPHKRSRVREFSSR